MKIETLSNTQVIVLAVALLGGDVSSIDREDIAIRANELAPGRFTWRKYTENIDLDAVGVALRDAKKTKNGGLLMGNNIDGWMLSPNGLKLFTTVSTDINTDSQIMKYRKDSILANQEIECSRLRTTNAYKLFLGNNLDKLTLQDFYQFTKVNEYYQKNTRKKRFVIIDNAVADDTILTNLWNILKTRYREEMI